MAQRFVEFLSAALRVPFWIPVVAALAGWWVLYLPDSLEMPDAALPFYAALAIGWLALIVIYFPVRTWRYHREHGVTMASVLVATGLLHALALAMFFWGPLVVQTGRSYTAEVLGFDFRVIPTVFLATWALVFLLIALRYERLGRFDATPWQRISAIGICVFLLGFAIGARTLVPELRAIWASVGADLPDATSLALAAAPRVYAVPLLGALLAGCVLFIPAGWASARKRAFDGLVALLLAANLGIVAGLCAGLLPMTKMCGSYRSYAESGFTRLHAAAFLGRPDSVARHIARGEAADVRDVNGVTPLQTALWGGHADAARVLLASGADVNARDESGRTPLQAAVAATHRPGSNLEIVQLLLARGADVDAATKAGDTALHRAVGSGRADVVALLLAQGAHVNAVAANGTPLDLAYLLGRNEVTTLLLDRGAVRATGEQRKAGQRRLEASARSSRSCG